MKAKVYHIIKEIPTGVKTIMPETGGRIRVKFHPRFPFNDTIRNANKLKRNNDINEQN
jgi:hypothetical protein